MSSKPVLCAVCGKTIAPPVRGWLAGQAVHPVCGRREVGATVSRPPAAGERHAGERDD